MEAWAHEHWFWLGVVGVIWLAWLTLIVVQLARQSPRELALELADLTDRFTRWQKRENIRAARDHASALQEATALLARAQGPAPAAELVPPEGTPEFRTWLRRKASPR